MPIDENVPPTWMKTAFFCRACGNQLTLFLSERDERYILFIPGWEVVPATSFIRLGRGWALSKGEPPRQFDCDMPEDGQVLFAAGDYLLRPLDIRHRKRPKLEGPGDKGEANAECAVCGNPIGTHHSGPGFPTRAFRLMWDAVDIAKA